MSGFAARSAARPPAGLRAATSGSSGRPLTVQTTKAFSLFFISVTRATTLAPARPDGHHRRHPPLRGRRRPPAERRRDAMWGLPVHPIYESGPMYRIPLSIDVAAQAEWLVGSTPTTCSLCRPT